MFCGFIYVRDTENKNSNVDFNLSRLNNENKDKNFICQIKVFVVEGFEFKLKLTLNLILGLIEHFQVSPEKHVNVLHIEICVILALHVVQSDMHTSRLLTLRNLFNNFS